MDIRIGPQMQTCKLGVSILNSSYLLVEMLAFGKRFCLHAAKHWLEILSGAGLAIELPHDSVPSRIVSIVAFPAVFTRPA
jgi:hypothetical protein